MSAKTPLARARSAERLADTLAEDRVNIGDAAWTLATGRAEWTHRAAVVGSNAADCARKLRTPTLWSAKSTAWDNPFPVFAFSGGGAQYVNMGSGLYGSDPVYTAAINRCASYLDDASGIDIRPYLTGLEASRPTDIERPSKALTTLFATQYALAQWWMSRGVIPRAFLGHSMGEYTAACLSGVFSLEDALDIVAVRGRLFESLPAGAMTSVTAPLAEVRQNLGTRLAIAAANGPDLFVVAGPVGDVERFEQAVGDTRRLHIDVAAHSPMIDAILPEFEEALSQVQFGEPNTPFTSNVTGSWITRGDATSTSYWVKHLRQTVEFGKCAETVLSNPRTILFEVGPGRTLTSLARMAPEYGDTRAVLSMRHPTETADDRVVLSEALATAWTHGAQVAWEKEFDSVEARRVSLPTYPFERSSYWIAPGPDRTGSGHSAPRKKEVGTLQKLSELSSWLYQTQWIPTRLRPPRVSDQVRRFVLVADAGGAAALLAESLTAEGHEVVVCAADPVALQQACDGDVTDVVLMSPLSATSNNPPDNLDSTFFALLELTQVFTNAGREDIRLYVASAGAFKTGDDDHAPNPFGAMLHASLGVIRKELPGFRCIQIDLSKSTPPREQAQLIQRQLLFEPVSEAGIAPVRAIRGQRTLSPTVAHVDAPSSASLIRRKGTYLFTGGLGGIALGLARQFAERYEANIVLLARAAFPAREQWDDVLNGDDLRAARRVVAIREIEQVGGSVVVESADVLSRVALDAALKNAEDRFGSVHGVFHTAGVIDDGPALTKTRESATRVLAPKVSGSLNVVAAARSARCEFVALFGSTSAFLAPEGQIDYASANAFVDAAAQALDTETCRVFAMNWGMWRNLGMTRRALTRPIRTANDRLAHVLFYGRSDRDGASAYHATPRRLDGLVHQ